MNKSEIRKKERIIFCLICLFIFVFIIGLFLFKYFKYSDLSNDRDISSLNLDSNDFYNSNDTIIFKGKNPNNYLRYLNILWRIISINQDGSYEIVMDSYVNILSNKNRNVNKYLNDIFLKNINKDDIIKTSYCLDNVNDINISKCDNISLSDYVRVPSIEEVVNSIENGKSYLFGNLYWLNNNSSDGVYVLNNENIARVSGEEFYQVRPVIRLKSTINISNGSGSKDNPYVVTSSDYLKLGSYVKLDNDIWTIYDIEKDKIGLSLSNGLSNLEIYGNSNKFDVNEKDNIANYLNNEYLDSLSYKDSIVYSEWCIGSYNDDNNSVCDSKVKSKVGMLSILDLKFNYDDKMFYLITPSSDYVYLYNSDEYLSKPNMARKIVPTIYINNKKIISGDGTKDNPYILEVE